MKNVFFFSVLNKTKFINTINLNAYINAVETRQKHLKQPPTDRPCKSNYLWANKENYCRKTSFEGLFIMNS